MDSTRDIVYQNYKYTDALESHNPQVLEPYGAPSPLTNNTRLSEALLTLDGASVTFASERARVDRRVTRLSCTGGISEVPNFLFFPGPPSKLIFSFP